MKKTMLLFILCFVSVVSIGQTAPKAALHFLTINQKKCIKRKGFDLKLKSVTADSRCPEDVTCVWAGEAQVVISVYKNQKLVEDYALVISSKTEKENETWFSQYLTEKQKRIKRISLLPIPRSGVTIPQKKYTIKLGYSD